MTDTCHVSQSLIFMMLSHMGETHRDGIPENFHERRNINIYNRSINFTEGEANADLILYYSKECNLE